MRPDFAVAVPQPFHVHCDVPQFARDGNSGHVEGALLAIGWDRHHHGDDRPRMSRSSMQLLIFDPARREIVWVDEQDVTDMVPLRPAPADAKRTTDQPGPPSSWQQTSHGVVAD